MLTDVISFLGLGRLTRFESAEEIAVRLLDSRRLRFGPAQEFLGDSSAGGRRVCKVVQGF